MNDPPDPDPNPAVPARLRETDCRILAAVFDLTEPEVQDEAILIADWHAPADELLAQLRHRHGWDVPTAFRYLQAVRRGLAQ